MENQVNTVLGDKKVCALIVEDNVAFRLALKNLLSSRFPSIAIEEAGDAQEAYQKIELFPPDFIFMDIKLPGQSGIELTKEIKNIHPDLIIIILTAHDLPEYKQASRQSGANYFVAKGSSATNDILTIVDSILMNLKPHS